MPLPAVEKCVMSVPWNSVAPPNAPLNVPPLLLNVPLPAVEVLLNCVNPPNVPLNPLPVLEKLVPVPAVALFVNAIAPSPPDPSTAVTKCCVIPELLVMPVPLMVNVCVGVTVIVKAFVAKELNMISATSVLAEIPTEVNVVARLNVAVSDDPLGRVLGVQSVKVFQSLPVSFHAALPAKVVSRAENKSSSMTAARKK